MRTLLILLAAAIVSAADPVVTASLVTGNPAGLVAPGREAEVALVVANPGAQPVDVALSGELTAFDGSSRPLAYRGTIAAAGEKRLAIPFDGLRRGHHALTWKLTVAGIVQPGQDSLVYARPAGPGQDPAGFRYGMCSHPSRLKQPLQEREMQAASQIGVGTMRVGVNWDGLEPKPGVWKWERLDGIVDLTEKYGMQVQTGLLFCAMHAASPETMARFDQAAAAKRKDAWQIWSRSAPQDAAWRSYVRAMAERYKDRIAVWEVWNEPDLEGFWKGTTDDYIRILRSAHEELKRVKPDAVVMSGGFAGVGNHPGHRLNPGLQERVLAEASDAFDIHAYHGHGMFMTFVQSVDGELARIRSRMPQSRPLYFNETAMHSKFGTLREQATTLVKKLAFARARGAVGYTWYDLRNDGTDPSDAEHNYGMLTIDFQPKPVYAAYNELIARMRGTRFIGSLDLGPGRYAYVFAGAGRRLAVAWNEEPGLPDDPIALVAEGCQAGECIDIMGNASPLPGRGGAMVIRLRDEPQWFELPGGESMPRVAGSLIAVEGNTLVARGEAPTLTARLVNPLDEPLVMTLAWGGDAGARRETRTSLPAHGQAIVPLEGAAAEPGDDPRQARVLLAYRAEGGPWNGLVAVPLRLVQRIPAGSIAGRSADWTLDRMDAVVDYCTADPALREQTWKGPQDLSARIWLGRTPENVLIHVEVRDNVHHQVEPADTAWRGDSVQLGIQAPGQKGFFELTTALHADGSILRSVGSCPAGMQAKPQDYEVRASRSGDVTSYDIEIPMQRFGFSDAVLTSGLRFNLVVNDNDGPLRKGYIRIAPGIGEGKDSNQFPLVRFDQR